MLGQHEEGQPTLFGSPGAKRGDDLLAFCLFSFKEKIITFEGRRITLKKNLAGESHRRCMGEGLG